MGPSSVVHGAARVRADRHAQATKESLWNIATADKVFSVVQPGSR